MYSPFDTPPNRLAAADLERLREVAEGWFVEYKREVSKAADIAKSISALANTYGGWVFYGVEEKSKDDPVAGAFPGIDASDADASLQRIRQAVAQHMDPPAHYEARTVHGDGITLPTHRVVICVRVSKSLSAPHVHSTGRIYRRVGDGSEPKPETDRHLLEQLFRRADDLRRDFDDWVGRDPEFSEGESNTPYIRLLMIADPWGDEEPWLQTSVTELKPLFAQATGLVGSTPFDTLYTSSRGYVARQTRNNDPHNLGLTWRFRESLVSDVYIPLTLYEDTPGTLAGRLRGYEQAGRFARILRANGYENARVVDLSFLFGVLIGVIEIQRRLLAAAGWTKPWFIKARLLNAWRTLPFLDVDAVVDALERDGLPVHLDSIDTAPAGTDPETFVEVAPMDETVDEQVRILLQAMIVMDPIAKAFGLASPLERELNPPMFQRLQAAGARAMEVQAHRSANGAR